MRDNIDYSKILSVNSVGFISKPFQIDEVLMHIHIHITHYHLPKKIIKENKDLKHK